MDPRLEVADTLTAAAKLINSTRSLDDAFDAVVEAAVTAIPGFDQASITLRRLRGDLETRTGVGPAVWDLDEAQYRSGEGPCLDALRSDRGVVAAEDLREEERWPGYVPAARQAGVRAQVALRLYADEEMRGGLNLYSTRSTATADAVKIAELFATHAGFALERRRYEEQLSRAISSRGLIGQAIGMMMERHQIDQDRAFQYLARESQARNVKLHAVAEQIVTAGNQTSRRP